MHRLSAQAVAALRALCDHRPTPDELMFISDLIRTRETAVLPLPGAPDEVSIILGPLPGRAVASAARTPGRLWVFLDPGKPDTRRHLQQLIDTWPLTDDCSRDIVVVPVAPAGAARGGALTPAPRPPAVHATMDAADGPPTAPLRRPVPA